MQRLTMREREIAMLVCTGRRGRINLRPSRPRS